jgi:hypothetical protein
MGLIDEVADADDEPRLVHAGAASVPHARTLATRPVGMRSNRIAGLVHAVAVGTGRSSRDGHTACRQNLPRILASAGPRALRPPPPRPAVAAAVPGNADFARGGAPGPAASIDTGRRPASAASPGLPPDIPARNNGSEHGWARTAARTASAGSDAAARWQIVEGNHRIRDTQAGPREFALPQVKPRSGAANLRSGALPLPAG